METSILALLIHAAPSREVDVIRINDLEEGLEFLVGGWFETITPKDWDQTWWLNEEGKILGLPFNARATELAHKHHAISLGDHIAGDLVVTGGIDDNGETLGLTEDEAVALIRDMPESVWPGARA